MTRVKKVLMVLGGLLALALVGVLTRFYVLLPNARAAADLKAPTDAATVERGRYLAMHVTGCIGCHSKVDESAPGEPLVVGHEGSGRSFNLPGFPGAVHAQNLTPDEATGLGAWSDGEIIRAMREGIGRDGRALFPMMPYQSYAKALSDADALAIVAYLRTLKPINNAVPETSLDFPVSMFIRGVPAPVTAPASALPPEGLERGKALLALCSCNDCHDGVNDRRQKLPGMTLAGGQPFPIPGKGTVYSANITMDPTTGIGDYTDEEILRALTQGVNKAGRTLYGMPWPYYAGMSDADKRSLVLALRQAAPVKNAVTPPDFK